MDPKPTATATATASTPTAAASTPTAATTPTSPTQGHPPYADMIKAAIVALKERNGSSRVAIANYISTHYSNFSAKHAALLNVHLKRLKDNGQLVMVKKSYKLPSSTPRSTPAAGGDGTPSTKKKLGRPFKSKEAQVEKSADHPALVVPFAGEGSSQVQPKSKSKSSQAQPKSKSKSKTSGPIPVFPDLGQSSGAVSKSPSLFVSLGPEVTPVRKQPGRKLKADSARKSNPVGQDGSSRVGRPPKNGPVDVGSESVKSRKRGRPVDVGSGSGKSRKRGRRPNASPAGTPVVPNPVDTPVPVPFLQTEAQPQPSTPASAKRRGRKPRALAEGSPNKPREQPSATPAVRPGKKNESAAAAAADVDTGESSAAYTKLKRKFEFLQAQVKETVSAVKPCLDEGTEAGAIGQLNTLEELATVLTP